MAFEKLDGGGEVNMVQQEAENSTTGDQHK